MWLVLLLCGQIQFAAEKSKKRKRALPSSTVAAYKPKEFIKLGTRNTGLTLEQQVAAWLLPYPGEKPEEYLNIKPISEEEVKKKIFW